MFQFPDLHSHFARQWQRDEQVEGEGGRRDHLVVAVNDAEVDEVAGAEGGRGCGAEAERRQRRPEHRQVSDRGSNVVRG